jgi:hypothetical protein
LQLVANWLVIKTQFSSSDKTIKSFNNSQKALTTRPENEHGNNKVQSWENVGQK